ncbi:hypothetical protein ACFQ6E_16335 [Streptomyces sp. NPDC056462]|uniref:hypothetical protein n=1 Tax=Streptomyces sp. NPDC056462 TaxID=3345826 RepID=UPI00367D51C9
MAATDRKQLLKEAADLVWQHALSGCATDPRPMAAAMTAARRAGITVQDIANYNANRPDRNGL